MKDILFLCQWLLLFLMIFGFIIVPIFSTISLWKNEHKLVLFFIKNNTDKNMILENKLWEICDLFQKISIICSLILVTSIIFEKIIQYKGN